MVEAVNANKPYQRAYLTFPTLKGQRGKVVSTNLSELLKKYHQNNAQQEEENRDLDGHPSKQELY